MFRLSKNGLAQRNCETRFGTDDEGHNAKQCEQATIFEQPKFEMALKMSTTHNKFFKQQGRNELSQEKSAPFLQKATATRSLTAGILH